MKKNVLLVEDNDDIRESAAELLVLEGFEITAADSGEKALEMVKTHKPDLIICDIIMSGMDGYQFFTSLQQNEKTKNIPFIFSTAKSEKVDREKATSLGVEYYLIKPFDEDSLMNTIKKCLQE